MAWKMCMFRKHVAWKNVGPLLVSSGLKTCIWFKNDHIHKMWYFCRKLNTFREIHTKSTVNWQFSQAIILRKAHGFRKHVAWKMCGFRNHVAWKRCVFRDHVAWQNDIPLLVSSGLKHCICFKNDHIHKMW